MPRNYIEYVKYEYTIRKKSSSSSLSSSPLKPTKTTTSTTTNATTNNDNFDQKDNCNGDDNDFDVVDIVTNDNNDGNSRNQFDKMKQYRQHHRLHRINDRIDDDNDQMMMAKSSNNNHFNDLNPKSTILPNEYDPYSYGFRPLSERNVYRSFEIIRTPTDQNDNQEKMMSSPSPPPPKTSTNHKSSMTSNHENRLQQKSSYDEVDQGHHRYSNRSVSPSSYEHRRSKTPEPSPSPTSSSMVKSTKINDRQSSSAAKNHIVPTIVVNERPIDVPGDPSSRKIRETTLSTSRTESRSQSQPRVIEIKVEKSNDETINQTSKKPPVHPNHHSSHNQRRTSMPAASSTHRNRRQEQTEPLRPSSSSAIYDDHHEYHNHRLSDMNNHHSKAPKVWQDFHYPKQHWLIDRNYYYDHKDSSTKCPYSSPESLNELINCQPSPTKFESYKCTRYELSKTTTKKKSC